MKTVSLCVSVHGSLAVVKIKSTTSLFYQVRNVQNYAVECTCQTKLKVCVSVFDLVSWRWGQTTVAVSAYTRTLVGTTHCPSERATVSGKIDLLLRHEKTSKCTCTWYYVCFSRKFHFCFGFWLWLATLHMSKASKRKRFQHSCRKEFQWLCYHEARNVIWCESYDGAKKRGLKLHNRNTFIESIGCNSLRK